MNDLLKDINTTLAQLKDTVKNNHEHSMTEVLTSYRDEEATNEMEIKAINNVLANKLILGKPEFALTNKLYPAYVTILMEIIHHQAKIADAEQDLHAISSKRILNHFDWLVGMIDINPVEEILEDADENVDDTEDDETIDNPNFKETVDTIKDELKKLGFDVDEDAVKVVGVKVNPDGTEEDVEYDDGEDDKKKIDAEKVKAELKKGLDDGVRKGKHLLNKVANKIADMTK